MTRRYDEDAGLWRVDEDLEGGGSSVDWFATKLEAHCYEAGYSCDGTDCPDPENCPCCQEGCC